MKLIENLGKHAIDRIMEKKMKFNSDERSEVPESVDIQFGDQARTRHALMIQLRLLIQSIRTDERFSADELNQNLFSDEITPYLEDIFDRFEKRGPDSSRCAVRKDLIAVIEMLSYRYQDMIVKKEAKERERKEEERARKEEERARKQEEKRDRMIAIIFLFVCVVAGVVLNKMLWGMYYNFISSSSSSCSSRVVK